MSFLFSFNARAGIPQQHIPINVGPHNLNHSVDVRSRRTAAYPEKTHDFRQSVDKGITL